jgi:transcription antitermination factor NusG
MQHWYAIHSKPQKEDFLYAQLALNQIETYYPRLRVSPVNPRARKARAYFPGYLFIRTDLELVSMSFLKWMPGAIGIVNFDGEPAPVPDGLLQDLRQRVEKLNTAGEDILGKLKPGDTVAIKNGPFAGRTAIFDVRLPGAERVRLLLELLHGQQIRVELPVGQISC